MKFHIMAAALMCCSGHSQSADDIQLAVSIASAYKVPIAQAIETVAAADTHASQFPTKLDILAVVGIESSHNPRARSQLKRDPAKGMMQVRTEMWHSEIRKSRASQTTIPGQIAVGSNILRQYYAATRNKRDAIMAYNIGIGAVKKGKQTHKYYSKFMREYRAVASATR